MQGAQEGPLLRINANSLNAAQAVYSRQRSAPTAVQGHERVSVQRSTNSSFTTSLSLLCVLWFGLTTPCEEGECGWMLLGEAWLKVQLFG